MPDWNDPLLARCQVCLHRKKRHIRVYTHVAGKTTMTLRCPTPSLTVEGVLRDQQEMIERVRRGEPIDGRPPYG